MEFGPYIQRSQGLCFRVKPNVVACMAEIFSEYACPVKPPFQMFCAVRVFPQNVPYATSNKHLMIPLEFLHIPSPPMVRKPFTGTEGFNLILDSPYTYIKYDGNGKLDQGAFATASLEWHCRGHSACAVSLLQPV